MAALPLGAGVAVPEGAPRSGEAEPAPKGRQFQRAARTSARRETILEARHEHLARSAPSEAPERTVVEHAVDPAHLLVRDRVEAASLRQHLADDAVAVLVRAALPRVVGLGEEHAQPQLVHEDIELRELLAVVYYQKFLIIDIIGNRALSGISDAA